MRKGKPFKPSIKNAVLEAELGDRLPTALKTGTTICGIVFKNGIVLGADTRATKDMVVVDKQCSKIHCISPSIYCCGAGTSADIDVTMRIISSNMELHALDTGRQPRVATACHMLKQMLFRYQGRIEASLILGGVDRTGPHLYGIYPHGSTDELPYVTMGSGSLAAMAVLEDRYKADMKEIDASQLVREDVAAGIFNDLGSGHQIDIAVITKDHVTTWPFYPALLYPDTACPYAARPWEWTPPPGDYSYRRGTTEVLTEDVVNFV